VDGSGYPISQHNNGAGTFVGGHNFGSIEIVDAKTSSAIQKVSKQAPQVAALLTRALDDGLIDPETAQMLAGAARNINEDVAGWIAEASRNINEDVAGWLMEAGRNINEDVAGKLSHTASEMTEAATRLERVVASMHEAAERLRSSKANVAEWTRTAAEMEHAAQELAMANQVMGLEQAGMCWNSFRKGTITGFALSLILAVAVIIIQANT
jgi:hypothetical protein